MKFEFSWAKNLKESQWLDETAEQIKVITKKTKNENGEWINMDDSADILVGKLLNEPYYIPRLLLPDYMQIKVLLKYDVNSFSKNIEKLPIMNRHFQYMQKYFTSKIGRNSRLSKDFGEKFVKLIANDFGSQLSKSCDGTNIDLCFNELIKIINMNSDSTKELFERYQALIVKASKNGDSYWRETAKTLEEMGLLKTTSDNSILKQSNMNIDL